MGKVMRHTLGASLNIRHNLSSSKGPKPLQLKLLTTYIPKTSAFTLAFSTSQRLRTTRASARKIGRASCRERVEIKEAGVPVHEDTQQGPSNVVHGERSEQNLLDAELPSSGEAALIALLFFFKQKTAYELGLGIPAEPLFRSEAPAIKIVDHLHTKDERLYACL